jgi:hypothetical protein
MTSTEINPLVKALLWAGIEDYCPLWQAAWEINTLIPELPEQERLDRTRLLVRTLLDQGKIELVWVEGASIAPIDLHAAQQLINQAQHWAPKHAHDRQLCFSTSKSGEQHYKAM